MTDLIGPWGNHPQGVAYVDTLSAHPVMNWLKDLLTQGVSRPRPVMMEALEAVSGVIQASVNPLAGECGFSGITEEACVNRGCIWRTDVVLASQPRCIRPQPKRKTVAVTFVWGEKWASLVPQFVGWMVRLRMGAVVVAMGEACRNACEAAVAAPRYGSSPAAHGYRCAGVRF